MPRGPWAERDEHGNRVYIDSLRDLFQRTNDPRLRSALLAVVLGRGVEYGARPREIKQVRITAKSQTSVEIPIRVINQHAKEIQDQFDKVVKQILIESGGAGSLRGEIRRQTERTNPLHKWGVRGGAKNPRTFRRVQAVTKVEKQAFAFVEQEYKGKGRGVNIQEGKGAQRVNFNVVAGSKGLTHTTTATGNKLSTLMLLNFGREAAEGGVVRAKFGKHLWFVPGNASMKQINAGQGKRLPMRIGNKERDPATGRMTYRANPLRLSARMRTRLERQSEVEAMGGNIADLDDPITRAEVESDILGGAQGRTKRKYGTVLSTVGKRMRYKQTGWAHGLHPAQKRFLADRLRPQSHRSLMRYGKLNRKLQTQPPGVKVVPKARHAAIEQESLKIDGKNLFDRVFGDKTREKLRDSLGRIIAEVLQRRTRKSLYRFDYTVVTGRAEEDISLVPREYSTYPDYRPTSRAEAKELRKTYGRGKVPPVVPVPSGEQLSTREFDRLRRMGFDDRTKLPARTPGGKEHVRPPAQQPAQKAVAQQPQMTPELRRAMIQAARSANRMDDTQKQLQIANQTALRQMRKHPMFAPGTPARKNLDELMKTTYDTAGNVETFRIRLNALLRQMANLMRK